MHSAFSKPIPHFNALGITAILAIVGAVVFAAWSNGVDATAYNGVDSDALELKAGLGAWAGLFLLVSITSAVGAVVLSGVEEIGRRVVTAAATNVVPPASTENAA